MGRAHDCQAAGCRFKSRLSRFFICTSLAIEINPSLNVLVQLARLGCKMDGKKLWEKFPLLYPFSGVQMKALAKKATKVEKMKNKKNGDRIWNDIEELSALVRSGEKTWEELNLDDIDVRTKWAGLFHRKKRAPGTFMMRLKVPSPICEIFL